MNEAEPSFQQHHDQESTVNRIIGAAQKAGLSLSEYLDLYKRFQLTSFEDGYALFDHRATQVAHLTTSSEVSHDELGMIKGSIMAGFAAGTLYVRLLNDFDDDSFNELYGVLLENVRGATDQLLYELERAPFIRKDDNATYDEITPSAVMDVILDYDTVPKIDNDTRSDIAHMGNEFTDDKNELEYFCLGANLIIRLEYDIHRAIIDHARGVAEIAELLSQAEKDGSLWNSITE